MKIYRWLPESPVAYHCCISERRCTRGSCTAWYPHPNDPKLGRCLFVPSVMEQEPEYLHLVKQE